MSFASLLNPIYTIIEDDIQTVARHRLHRDLTDEELHVASYAFANGMDWWDVAACAVDEAVAKCR